MTSTSKQCLACDEPAEAPSLFCARCRDRKAKQRARQQEKNNDLIKQKGVRRK